MAEEEFDVEITREDIESLAEKLEVFAGRLDDKERDVLAHVLRQAAEANEAEVAGFSSFGSPMATSLRAGIGPDLKVPQANSIQMFPTLHHNSPTPSVRVEKVYY
jgi:hypothetical protein